MKQWQIKSSGNLSLIEKEDIALSEGLAKVKIMRAGISSLDCKVFWGSLPVEYPLVPLRHAAGVVVDALEQSAFPRGTRVLLNPYSACGVCHRCKEEHYYACENLAVFGLTDDGFLRDFITFPQSLLHYLPDHVKDNEAVFVDHIALALNTLTTLNIKKGDYIAIIGAGITGMCMAQAAIYYQAIPIIIDANEQRLAMAQDLGIYYTIDSKEGAQKKLNAITGGNLCECVVYSCSSGALVSDAFLYAAKNGRIAFAGWDLANTKATANLREVISKNLSLYGVTNGYKHIPNAINMLANKVVNVSPMIAGEVAFAEADKCFEQLNAENLSQNKIIIKA